MASLVDQLSKLVDLPPARLRAEWRRLHRGQPMPEGMSTDLMARSIAWKMQERAHGGLAPTRLRDLDRLARQLQQSGDLDLARQKQLKAGTSLVREWHGKVYVVTVLDEGYLFDDRQYASLTPIARQITGASWSGPRFFGLKSRKVTNGSAEE
ncbi:MAG: DUF2924 domain-containing protein [Sphingobium sp.]|nr:DUF2924 domain-containing protein [Sphingobium sp.]MBP6110816.1 DUF2924 domain-containing protein [Sphingobium sp.]MBP8671939.1 DUF2924 domain-containing protein [Sphingobium sp.]MBP9157504.1 DUF2924 domain-containing protein [Sphingobium sp.]